MPQSIFHSDKKTVSTKSLPSNFIDEFPIAAVHESGAILLRGDGAGIGVVLHSTQSGASHQQRIMAVAGTWIKSLDLGGGSLTVVTYRFENGGGGGNAGILISLVLSGLSVDGGGGPSKIILSKEKLYEIQATKTLTLIKELAEDFARVLRANKIIAYREEDAGAMLRLCREFMFRPGSENVGKVKAEDYLEPIAFFSEGLSIFPSRSFWIENSTFLRRLFSAKSVQPQVSKMISNAQSTLIDSLFVDKVLNRFFETKESPTKESLVKESGLHIMAVAFGGASPNAKHEAVSGTGKFKVDVFDEIEKISQNLSSEFASKFDVTWRRFFNKKTEEDVKMEKEKNAKGSLKFCRYLLASLDLKKNPNYFGTWAENKMLMEHEREIKAKLFDDTDGILWSVWDLGDPKLAEMGFVYSLIPGAMRLDSKERMLNHDVFCLEISGD
jgi:hypothetical protein